MAPVRLPGRRRDAGGPGRDLEGRGQRRGGRYRDPARRAGRRRDPGRARDRTGTRKTPGGRGPDARRDARDADPGTRPRRDGRRPRRARDPRGTRAGFRRDPHGRRRRRRTPDAARDAAGTRAGPGPDPRDAASGTRPGRRGTRPRPAADGAKDAGTARCLGAPERLHLVYLVATSCFTRSGRGIVERRGKLRMGVILGQNRPESDLRRLRSAGPVQTPVQGPAAGRPK